MQAVVFDWDGTLVDTLGALYRANLSVLEALGLPFDETLYRRHYAPDWRLLYSRLGVPANRLDEANEHWRQAFDAVGVGEPFPGTPEALERLRASGVRLGLVTAGDRDVVGPQITRAGLDRLIEVRVYGDDLPVHKPDPRPLRVALAELGVADCPGEAAYVGDAPDDMRMARAAGAAGIGIASILGDPGELRAAGATAVARSVVEWVEELLASAGDPAAARVRRPA
ncbi:MAG: HAD family hydrolase [Chloroflexota bacterium]|nr:HAD family hydrolase [Chloroflexota bacterium]